MALILCPECKKEVSDRVMACVHCGFPLPKAKEEKSANSMCLIDNQTLNFDKAVEMFYNGQKSKAMSEITSTIQRASLKCNKQEIMNLKIFIMKYVDAIGEIPECIDTKSMPPQKLDDIGPIIDRWYNDDNAHKRKPLPACPTCGSTTITKLGVLDRAISFELVGFASNKIGKSFKCRNCGYTW